MNALDFARKIIDGPAGMNSYEAHELPVWTEPDRVCAAHWTLRCLANPDCEGSGEALDAILRHRKEATR